MPPKLQRTNFCELIKKSAKQESGRGDNFHYASEFNSERLGGERDLRESFFSFFPLLHSAASETKVSAARSTRVAFVTQLNAGVRRQGAAYRGAVAGMRTGSPTKQPTFIKLLAIRHLPHRHLSQATFRNVQNYIIAFDPNLIGSRVLRLWVAEVLAG